MIDSNSWRQFTGSDQTNTVWRRSNMLGVLTFYSLIRNPRSVFKSSAELILLSLAFWCISPAYAAEPRSMQGLQVTFLQGAHRDHRVLPEFSLFVPHTHPASPLLNPGAFTSVWETSLILDLRSDMMFAVELSGSFRLDINDTLILETNGMEIITPFSKPVRLAKGPNHVKATFSTPAGTQSDAYFRVMWAERPFLVQPVPPKIMRCTLSTEASQSIELHRGRELALELQCYNCHEPTGRKVTAADKKAPDLTGIGQRRNFSWLVSWILNPTVHRRDAEMPRVLQGPQAAESAHAIASYLVSLPAPESIQLADPPSLKLLTTPVPPAAPVEGEPAKALYEQLLCQQCHLLDPKTEPKEERISLLHIQEKFPSKALVEFLLQPEQHFSSIRMPNFRLSRTEAEELANFLTKTSRPDLANAALTASKEPELIRRGKQLTSIIGCFNCHLHSSEIDSNTQAPKWTELRAKPKLEGCISETENGSKSPYFQLSTADRQALRAWVIFDRGTLSSVPLNLDDTSTRLSATLRCGNCHGAVDGLPLIDQVGAKLRPDWMRQFIAGKIDYKPRGEFHPRGEPWMRSRMPAFNSYADALASGFAARHGFGPASIPTSKPNAEVAETGRKLAGKAGGFSCISCHAAGKLAAMDVFEVEGINFAYVAERLLPNYYRRWMRSPISIDPQTKMPAYFDEEGKSQLADIFEGDAEKQIDALWEYFLQGRHLTPPAVEPAP